LIALAATDKITHQLMDTSSEESLFKSTGKIALAELIAVYPDMGAGDIVLKLAEHKNFDAARAVFQTWDEDSVIIADNLFSQNYRHQADLYATRDKYIAVSFLRKLISDWGTNRLEQRNVTPATPGQQQAGGLLAIRLQGKLPHIDLAGTDFTIDWRLRQLRETEFPWKNISFEQMDCAESGEEYLFFYHTETHQLVIPEDDLTELPENVVVLEIPYENRLDPVAVARELQIDAALMVLDYPIEENLAAHIIPLSESGLPEMIEYNLKMKNNDHSSGIGR
jgi:hypothetical protein